RKGQYGGFYTYDNIEDVERFAQGNKSANIHKITLVPGTKISDYEGSIERLDKNKLDELRAKGYKVIRGKSIFGKDEIIIIDKSAISSIELKPTTKQNENNGQSPVQEPSPNAEIKEDGQASQEGRSDATDQLTEVGEGNQES